MIDYPLQSPLLDIKRYYTIKLNIAGFAKLCLFKKIYNTYNCILNVIATKLYLTTVHICMRKKN